MAREVELRFEEPEHADEGSEAPEGIEIPQPVEDRPKPQVSDLARFLKQTKPLLPTAVLGILLLALIAFLYLAKPFVMPIMVALLLTFALKPMVKALCRLHVPEALAALIVIAAFFGLLSFGMTKLLQPAAEWAQKAPETMSTMRDKFHHLFRRAQRLSQAAQQVQDITQEPGDKAATPSVSVKEPVLMKTVFIYTKSFVAALIETVVLLYFMLAGDLFMQKLIHVLPTLNDKKRIVGIVNELQHSVSTFIFTISAINAVLGTVVGLAVWALGLPNPALWGVMAGVLNFIPYFGPLTGVTILALVGFMSFDQPWRSALPALVYLCLHGVESNFFTPMILGRRLTLNPLIIFISLMFWTWLWGISGALLSIPLLMMFKIFCDHFKPLGPIGEFLSG